jgi:transketolase
MSQTTPRKLTTSAMIASFVDQGQRTTNTPFGHVLSRLADQRPEIVGLSADLAKYTDMHIFREAHPDRFFHWTSPSPASTSTSSVPCQV